MHDDPTRDADHAPRSAEARAAELRGRLEFLGLGEEDARRLDALRPLYRAELRQFVESFYEHLFSFEQTSQFLQDPERVARLKQFQAEHFESMLAADWDEEYVANRLRVGQVHAEVGIEPEWFLGAYNHYAQYWFRAFARARGDAWGDDMDWALSLLKVIFFDIGLTLDAYFAESTRNLQYALDMLWRANDQLRRFAQLTSHDLKTPLATVANLCDEAVDEFADTMPAEARHLIEKARDGTYRMSGLIDELLAASVADREGESAGVVDLAGILREAVERAQPVLDQKQIALTVPTHFPQAWGVHVPLREAIYNLLANAAKFSDKRPGKITVTAAEHENGVLLTVADNGPGIPTEELDRIFVPFRRLPAHRDLPGSGLGLYFAKNLIEQQGGRLWAESELAQGSRFHIWLRASAPKARGAV